MLFFDRAAQQHGITGETLLQMLEMRLDNLVYRFGFQSLAARGAAVRAPSAHHR